jgi:hypothetical protein
VRFASDCRAAIKVVTTELDTKLGHGTGDLSLRIGLHSGAVTAGVSAMKTVASELARKLGPGTSDLAL